MTGNNKMIDSSDKITLTLLLQVLINTAQEARRKFLRILPLKLNLPLHLSHITQKILKLRGLGSKQRQIPSRLRNETQIQRNKLKRPCLLTTITR
jgi:hypothetical protein